MYTNTKIFAGILRSLIENLRKREKKLKICSAILRKGKVVCIVLKKALSRMEETDRRGFEYGSW